MLIFNSDICYYGEKTCFNTDSSLWERQLLITADPPLSAGADRIQEMGGMGTKHLKVVNIIWVACFRWLPDFETWWTPCRACKIHLSCQISDPTWGRGVIKISTLRCDSLVELQCIISVCAVQLEYSWRKLYSFFLSCNYQVQPEDKTHTQSPLS